MSGDAHVHPGDVTVWQYPEMCEITSPPDQWSDESDATYAKVSADAFGSIGAAQAPLPQAGFIPDNCTDVHMRIRASASTNATQQGVQMTVYDNNVGTQIGSIGVASHLVDGTYTDDGAVIADGTIHEYLFRWSDVDSGGTHSFELIDINTGSPTWSPADFAAWVLANPTIIIARAWQPGWMTYYEVELILVGASDVVTAGWSVGVISMA